MEPYYKNYVLETLLDRGLVTAEEMLIACLKYMSEDDVYDMLEANGLRPEDGDWDNYE